MTTQAPVEEAVVIRHEQGLHARPAAQLARIASRYQANTTLIKDSDGSEADCRSVLSLLVLAAGNGSHLTVRGDGPDAAEAVQAVVEFFASGFDQWQ